MTDTIKLLDVVALTVDLPEYNLWRGQVGTVVEILAGSAAYEVEFSDREATECMIAEIKFDSNGKQIRSDNEDDI